jgi:hypothetical protein
LQKILHSSRIASTVSCIALTRFPSFIFQRLFWLRVQLTALAISVKKETEQRESYYNK